MGATEELVKFAVELEFEQIPAEAVIWAKDAILDYIGVALAGTQEDAGKIITNYVKEGAGRPEAGVLAAGFKTTAGNAALANGTMAHALDFDDWILPNWMGHPTAPLLPGILALGQRQEISGKDVLLAYVIGFEVGGKIGAGVGRGHYEDCSWHPTCTLGTMGAAAACCNILKLDLGKALMALGIASSEASGVRQNFGTMTKPLHAGLASRNGVMAALLAQQGFTGDRDGIAGPLGFSSAFTKGDGVDLNKMTEGLGESFIIVENGVGIKPYPCCGDGHRCLDAIFYLIKEHKIKADEVASVECRTSDMVPQIMMRHRPKTGSEAKFSMEFGMAIALVDGKAGLEQYRTDRVLDPKVQELIKRVNFVNPPEASGYLGMETYPEQVTVRLQDGSAYSHEVLESKGRPGNRMSQEELVAKYSECAARAISPERIDQSLDMLHRLEDLTNINELMDLICS
jgi:2-methylcitrate dehydratase PrpD